MGRRRAPLPPPQAQTAAPTAATKSMTAAVAATTAVAAAAVAALQRWLLAAGIWWDPALLAIQAGTQHCSGPALRVEAAADVGEGDLLCVIPKCSILSAKTTSLASILEQEQLGGGLALTIAAMYEAARGEESFWYGYFCSLPPREYLPMFWTPQEEALAAGTQLEGAAAADREDTESDYLEHVAPLMEKYRGVFTPKVKKKCGLEGYRAAASWVASRAFYIDAYHGDALVPLADVFNHKASVVALHPDYEVGELRDRGGHGGGANFDQVKQGIDQVNGQLAGAAGEAEQEQQEEGVRDGKRQRTRLKQELPEQQQQGEHHQHQTQQQHQQKEQQQQQFVMVGGGAAAAAGTGGRPTLLSSSSAAAWQRDGLNLRLEIGICSCGPDGPPGDTGDTSSDDSGDTGDGGDDNGDSDDGSDSSSAGDAGGETGDGSDGGSGDGSSEEGPPPTTAAAAAAVPAHLQDDPTAPTPHPPQPLPPQRLEIIAASGVPKGQEVHNTYGELSNCELVQKYGFALSANPFDELPLAGSWEEAVEQVLLTQQPPAPPAAAGGAGTAAAGGKPGSKGRSNSVKDQQAGVDWSKLAALGGERQLRRRLRWLRTHSDLVGPGAEPPAVMPHGRVPHATYAVLRVLCAPEEVFGGWHSMQDALDGTPVAAAAAGAAADAQEAAAAAAAHEDADGQQQHQQQQQEGAEDEVAARFSDVPILLTGWSTPSQPQVNSVNHDQPQGQGKSSSSSRKRQRGDPTSSNKFGGGGTGTAATGRAAKFTTKDSSSNGSGSSSSSGSRLPPWTPSMLQLLQALVWQRRQQYPAGVDFDQELQALTEFTEPKDRAAGEHAAAVRAALTLRRTELGLLEAAAAAAVAAAQAASHRATRS